MNLVFDVREIRTFRELIEGSVENYGDKPAFVLKDKYNNIYNKTYKEFYDDVIYFSTYLNSLGYEGKKIAVSGKNSYEWAVTYLAVCCGTGIIVPIDKELKAPDIENILNMSDSSVIICSPEIEKEINGYATGIPRLLTSNFDEYLFEGKQLLQSGNDSYLKHIIDPYSLGVLLYTSGTTGVAKGVMLSQYNICFDIVAVSKSFRITSEDRVLSVLPLHHTYECTVGFLCMIFSGASIAYIGNIRSVPNDLKLYAPTIIIAVPLLLESIHSNIIKKINSKKGGSAIMGIGRGLSAVTGRMNIDFKNPLFKQIREFFGGRLRAIACGAAALSPEIYSDYNAFGIKIFNGYGLTETSPVCIMQNESVRGADNIGVPLSGIQVKLVDVNAEGIGEIAIKGKNVMLGYYNNPEETEKVMDNDWFLTGDLGTVDKNGCYKIVGRIKNMIVTKNGKKTFPEELEYYLSKSKFVKESMAYGALNEKGDTIVAARIFPDYDEVDAKLNEKGILPDDPSYDEEVKLILLDVIKGVNRNLPSYKMIHKLTIRKTEFDKTTTKKIKRNSELNNID